MNGSCLCRKIQFEVSEFHQNIANCHCSMCRKFHGAAFATYATAKTLKWRTGEDFLKTYKSSEKAERGFCSNCGSSIFYKLLAEDSPFEISLGVLDCEPNHSVTANIYWDSKPQWSENHYNLPKYSESRVKP